ncbi:MAG: hypothetical protein V1745_01685 [Patescibacteria group bacterium]
MGTQTKKRRDGLRDLNGRLTRIKAGDRIAFALKDSTVCIYRKDSDNIFFPLRWPLLTADDDKRLCPFLRDEREFTLFAIFIGLTFGLRPHRIRSASRNIYTLEFK